MADNHTQPSDSDPSGDSDDDSDLNALLDRLASPPTERPRPRAGDLVGEGARYRLDRQLGRGGQGVVFLSRDLKLDRPVAIKFAQPRQDEDDAAWARRCEAFEHEIRLLAQLQQDPIVTTYDRGLWNDVPFLVMEHLQGQTLTELLAERGRLPPRRAIHIATQIAQALKAAHDLGIIHRDLKPDNIFVLPDEDRVRILDFGMAWFNPAVAGGQLSNEVPLDDEAVRRHGGTALYMAPEQWRRSGDQDARTDIWAFGVILFEMLMGHHPFRHDNLSPKTTILTGRAHPITLDAPNKESVDALTRLLNRCMETEQARRPTNIYLILRDLNHIQQTLEHGVDFDSPKAAPTRSAWRRALLIVAALVAALLLIVVALGVEVHRDRAGFQNRVAIYAQKAGADTLRGCLGAQDRDLSLCAFGPHTRTNRDGASFHLLTLVLFLSESVTPLEDPTTPPASPAPRSSP